MPYFWCFKQLFEYLLHVKDGKRNQIDGFDIHAFHSLWLLIIQVFDFVLELGRQRFQNCFVVRMNEFQHVAEMGFEFIVCFGVGTMEHDVLYQMDGQILQNWSDAVLFVTHDSQKNEDWVIHVLKLVVGDQVLDH